MNKKILSIFALIMAISILGVSCAENPNNPNNGNGGSTPALSLANAKKVVKAIGTLSPSGANFDLATASEKVSFVSGNNYKVEVTDASSTGNVTTDALKTALDAKKDTMGKAVEPNITIGSISVAAPTGDNKSVVATIPYTTKDGKKGNIKITFKLENNNFTGGVAEDKDPNIAIGTGAKDSALTATLADEETATTTGGFSLTGSDNGETYTYTVTKIDGLAGSTVAGATTDTTGVTYETTGSSVDGSEKIVLGAEAVTALKEKLAGSKIGAIKVTITATADGFKPKDLEVYVKVTGPAAAQKTPITKTALQGEIANWGNVADTGKDELVFTGAQLTVSGGKVTTSIKAKDSAGTAGPSVADIKAAIQTLTSKKLTGIQTIEVTTTNFDAVGNKDQVARTFTITLTAADTHEFNTTDFTAGVSGNKLTIEVSVAPTSDGSSTGADWAD